MVAVFEDSSTQFRVQEGEVVDIDLRKEAEVGSEISFDKVCLLDAGEDTKVGAPYVEGASVKAKVLEAVKGPRVISTHFRRRKASKTRVGHRQQYLRVKIEKIEG